MLKEHKAQLNIDDASLHQKCSTGVEVKCCVFSASEVQHWCEGKVLCVFCISGLQKCSTVIVAQSIVAMLQDL